MIKSSRYRLRFLVGRDEALRATALRQLCTANPGRKATAENPKLHQNSLAPSNTYACFGMFGGVGMLLGPRPESLPLAGFPCAARMGA
jgi:hypothetical protein